MIENTKYFSKKIGDLPKGCKQCVLGKKTVIFITGICPRNCFYCPISSSRKNTDVIFINEVPLESETDFNTIFEESESHNSTGAGITGGDPLSKLNRTVKFIEKLKEHFGKDYHIHLYTSLDLVNHESLKKLYDAGLDEIRFHLDLYSKKLWDKLSLAKEFSWDIGVEIPVVPDTEKKTKDLIDFINDKVMFLNLNELEFSETNESELVFRGYDVKNNYSYAVKRSSDTALRLMKYVEKKKYNLRVHFCTAQLKDGVQLLNRMRLKAENLKLDTDIKTKSGTLIRGCIFLKELSPKKLKTTEILGNQDPKIIEQLKDAKSNLESNFKEKIHLDTRKKRLLVSAKKLTMLYENQKLPTLYDYVIIEEYPTFDAIELDLNFLN